MPEKKVTTSESMAEASQPGGSQAASPEAARNLIEVNHFNFFYGQKQALFDIKMGIPRSKVTAFIGPSGCGKSTLLRNFNRMNDMIDGVRHEGDITLGGRSIYDPKLQIIARADSDACMAHLQKQGADLVVLAEPELARGMLERLRASEIA